MKELDINFNDFTEEHPSEPGDYMWAVGDSLRIIAVVRVPAKSIQGTKFESFLGVVEFRNRDVTFLSGKFIKLKV